MSPAMRRTALGLVLAAVVTGAVAAFRIETEVATWSGPQLAGNWDVIAHWFLEHVRFTLTAVVLGTLVSLPLAYLSIRWPKTYPAMLTVTNVIYAVPSIALIVMLASLNTEIFGVVKFSYLSDAPVVVAMTLYTLIILVRNIVEAVRSVPDAVVRAADGMGYRRFVRFVTVELPLALPGVIAGLRLATVSTVSLISVGALSGRGGLGRLFADGRRRGIVVELWSGIVSIVVLALALDAVLVLIGWLATPWARARPQRALRRLRRGPALVAAREV